MTKPTQGAVFKGFRDQLMGFTEAQDPGPGNPKKVVKMNYVSMVRRTLGMRNLPTSKYGHKAAIHAAPSHRSVLGRVS